MKLNSKLLIAGLVGLAVIFIVSLTVTYMYYNSAKQERVVTVVEDARQDLQSAIEAKKKVWLTNALQIANNPKVKNALLNDDREKAEEVLNELGSTFKQNTTFNNVKIHLIGKGLNSFYKSWNPEDFGESLEYSKGYSLVKQNKKSHVGMEVSPKGLRLKGLFPIIDQGEFIGIANFEGGLNSIKRTLKPYDIDFLYFMHKDSLDIARGLQDNPGLGEYVLSQKDLNQEFWEYIQKGDLFERLLASKQYVMDDNYLLLKGNFQGFDNTRTGLYLLGIKTGKVMESIYKLEDLIFTLFFVLFLLFLLFVAGMILYISRGVIRPILQMKDKAENITQGNLESAQLTIDRKDEIGTLANEINKMSDEIRKTIDYYETVLDEMATPFVWTDNKANVKKLNKALARLFEEDDRERLIGRPLGLAFFNDPNQSTYAHKMLEKKEPLLGKQTQIQTRKGNQRHVQVDAVPMFDQDGELASIFMTTADITDIKINESRVQEQNQKINELSKQAKDVSERLASASEELSSQIEEASNGAEEQQKRSSEVATAMEQMNSSILEISRNSSSAAEQSESTKKKAREGKEIVEHVSEYMVSVNQRTQNVKSSMDQLSQDVQGINQVMDMINDIADQTNLLALNAAIEAARAGEAGKGFAVVADEVRKLAEKTMEATKEVGTTISSITSSTEKNVEEVTETEKAVQDTSEQSRKASGYLEEIVGLAESNAEQVQSIATSSEEQSSASEQVNQSTEEVNRTAKEASETMQQAAQAISELNKLAQEIDQIVKQM